MSYGDRVSAYRFADEASWPHIVDPESGREIAVAPFATDQQAIARMNADRAGQLREIRLFPGWGSEWALWEDEYGPRSPNELGLSETLSAKLKLWSDTWREAADYSLNQALSSGEQLPPEWFDEGENLLHDLAVELWSLANVFPVFRY